MKIIVDASVAVKLVAPEIGQKQAFDLLRLEAIRLAPELLLVESANTLWKKAQRGELVLEQARAGIDLIRDAIEIFVPDAELATDALRLAFEIEHPVYDCLYLALARREDATLITADMKLLNRVGSSAYSRLARPLAASN